MAHSKRFENWSRATNLTSTKIDGTANRDRSPTCHGGHMRYRAAWSIVRRIRSSPRETCARAALAVALLVAAIALPAPCLRVASAQPAAAAGSENADAMPLPPQSAGSGPTLKTSILAFGRGQGIRLRKLLSTEASNQNIGERLSKIKSNISLFHLLQLALFLVIFVLSVFKFN